MDTDPITTPPEPTRGRGAPKGNLNAFKHGFYSKRFRVGEIDDLIKIPLGSLKDEIAMLRVITRRAGEMLEAGEPIENVLPTYDFIGKMCIRLSNLMRTEKVLEGRLDLTDELIKSIETFRVEIKGHDSEQELP